MIWPFNKVSPAVKHIIESLATDPDSWTLSDYERRWKGGEKVYKYPEWTRETISTPCFRLTHSNNLTILHDKDATDYSGWAIEKPKHIVMSLYDRKKLSQAVKVWRELQLKNQLAVNKEESKLLEEAMKELEDEL